MNLHRSTGLLATGLVLAVLTGCATQPATTAKSATDTQTVIAQSDSCEAATGSRIRGTAKENCSPVGYPIKSYSSDDLNSTGSIDLAEALRTLDPGIR